MKFKINALALSILLFVSPVWAGDENGFSGSIAGGFMFIYSSNNLNPEHSDKIINDLSSGTDQKSEIVPLLLPQMAYNFGTDGQFGFYLDTDPAIDEVGDFSIQTGYVQRIQGVGVLDVGVFTNPFEKAWENPYLVGTARQDTDVIKYGAKIALNRIMSTGLRLNVVYMKDDVDNDTLGKVESDLARDGNVLALNANYSFEISEDFQIRPRLSFRKGTYDGESNSFKKIKFDIEAEYRTGKFHFVPRFFISRSEYEKLNPIFGKTRQDDGYGAELMVRYDTPFNIEDLAITGLVSYSKGDANINFFDTKSFSCGLAIQYTF